jgi:hypothetical protein
LLRHQWNAFGQAKNMIGNMSCRARPARGAARLQYHRMPLRGGNDAERSLHLKEFSGVIDRMNFGWIGHGAGLLVPDEGVGRHAVPKLAADVDELFQSFVSLAVLDQFIISVVGEIRRALRGDDVECDPAVGDVVERVEQARRVKRMHERRSVCKPETEMAGHARHGGDPWAHLKARPGNAVADGVLDGVLPGARDARTVAEEDHVKSTAFGGARDLLEHADIRMMPIDP